MQEVNTRESRADKRTNVRIAIVLLISLVVALIHDVSLIIDPIDRAHVPGLMTLGVVAVMFVAYKLYKNESLNTEK